METQAKEGGARTEICGDTNEREEGDHISALCECYRKVL
jgi:hypothetical protein